MEKPETTETTETEQTAATEAPKAKRIRTKKAPSTETEKELEALFEQQGKEAREGAVRFYLSAFRFTHLVVSLFGEYARVVDGAVKPWTESVRARLFPASK
jgi:hypothetical protein